MMDERLKSEITVLQEISSAIVHERNVDAVLNKVLDVLNRRMGMLRGTFTLRHGDTLVIEASQGLDEAEKQLGRYRIGEGITGHVAETGRPHLIPDIRSDHRFLNRTKSRDYKDPVAFICVPIIHLEQVIGTLSIDRLITPDTDLENDMALLEIIGNIAAEAVAAVMKEHEERESLLEENRKLREMLSENPGEMVGNCRAMQQVYALIRQVAPSDATVLIRGSSGTGKELVARAIVNLSNRKDKPFVCLNCAALPENLAGLWFGGGFPELYVEALSRNCSMLEAIRAFAASGRPVYGECGGYLYLLEALTDFDGVRRPLLGLLPGEAVMGQKLASLGYRELTSCSESLFGPAGTKLRGHEFHYSFLKNGPSGGNLFASRDLRGVERPAGSVCGNLCGSYIHLHFASNPAAAEALVRRLQA